MKAKTELSSSPGMSPDSSPGRDQSGQRCPPVLILAFNRPDTTAAVIESIRTASPAQVYLAVDGARADRPQEQERVQEVQRLVDRIDWPCSVQTLFRASNLGCKHAVTEAITWFFRNVEAGIILEDDCVADPTFFRFGAEMLDRFRDDERIAMVSGDNFQFGRRPVGQSYYFSRYTHIWGWATWRRAWSDYDFEMKHWPELRHSGWLQGMLGNGRHARYWTAIFDETHANRNSSWAYRWIYSAWVQSRLTVLPGSNLVSNIGFGAGATHNWRRRNRFASMATEAMEFPLVHPPCVIRDAAADLFTQETMFSRPLWRSVARAAYRRLRQT